MKKIAVLLQVLVEQYERNFTQFESANELKKFALKFLTVITKAIQVRQNPLGYNSVTDYQL